MDNREFYIDHDGIPLHAKLDFPEERKEGERCPLLILVHGLTGHMEEDHIRGIASRVCGIGFAVLRVELYGHGKSGGAFGDHTVFKWLSEMLTVVDYAAGLPFVTDLYLAGHSQGGLTAIIAGAMNADRIKAILPLSPATVIRLGAEEGRFLGASYDRDHIPKSLTFPNGAVLSGNYLRAARFLPLEDAVRYYRGPVLLVHGEADEAVPFACSVQLAEMYENARLFAVPGDDHGYHRHLDMVEEAVADFLLECGKRGGKEEK